MVDPHVNTIFMYDYNTKISNGMGISTKANLSHTTSYSTSLSKRDTGAIWNPDAAKHSSRALKMNSKYSSNLAQKSENRRKLSMKPFIGHVKPAKLSIVKSE